MLIATQSYCKREIIPVQRVVSAAKSNVSRKMVYFGSAEDSDTVITYR